MFKATKTAMLPREQDQGTEASGTKKEKPETRKSQSPGKTIEGRPLEVTVDERGVERALRKLKRLIATEGVTRELKRRRAYEKPSVKKRRKTREAERRRRRTARRAARKATERGGR